MSTKPKAVLLSTYELGRQPFGLASPAAWLRRAGAEVTCLDLSRQALSAFSPGPIAEADFIAFYVPMHTATRLAVEVLPAVRSLNPRAHLCFYGLYAPVNEAYLRKLGVDTILGGEFEAGLVSAFERLRRAPPAAGPACAANARPVRQAQAEPLISVARQDFVVPDRRDMPPLSHYAHLNHPSGKPRVVGYTEASRGCKHLCRHCPIVPVYNGRFRIVPQEVVLADIRQQVAAGAEHITLGDPDFFNGIRHAVEVVRGLHAEHPTLTYDVTIKIEHLLQHAQHLRTLRDTGCLFVTSAVESMDDAVLARLAKGHTYADFASVVDLCRDAGLALAPTFVVFTLWITLEGYCGFLERIAALGLVEQVAPIQLAIRLLIPAGSRLLDLVEVREMVAPFDEAGLVYPWAHPDPRVDELCQQAQAIVERGQRKEWSRRTIFTRIWKLAHHAAGLAGREIPQEAVGAARATVPYLTEPWYC
ncbi:MAG: CUAEP/CCAEP-tail radical SAM (seleno)protein [Terriglobia bacterium]